MPRFDYMKKKSKENKEIQNLTFDISELSVLTRYIVSSNKNINRHNLENLRKVLKLVDKSALEQSRLELLDVVSKGLEARLEYGLHDKDMILSHIAGGLGSSETKKEYEELDNNEISWVDSMVSNVLKYSYLQEECGDAIELFTQLQSSDYSKRDSVVVDISSWLNKVQNKIRHATVTSIIDSPFSLRDNIAIEMIKETYTQATSPQNVLKFGTSGLNVLTGGGLYAQKVYIFFGLPGEGKSALLLDMAIQIKKYNKDYRCQDPTKKPCVFLSIMENSIIETVERLYNMLTLTNIKDCPSSEVAVKNFLDKGFKISDDDPIDLVIDYRPGLSEDTSYLYKRIDDLADEGYEVICILQDYLKRIHSVNGTYDNDIRREYGAIVNEFKTLATIRNIPLASASQLNRDATNKIDNARTTNKADLVRLIGRSNIGESTLILENTDWSGLITPETDARSGRIYLGIQKIKSRYFIDGPNCLFMPYLPFSIKLEEDIFNQHPSYRESLSPEDGFILNNGMSNNIMGSTGGSIKIVTRQDNANIVNLNAKEGNIFEMPEYVAKSLSLILPHSNPYGEKRQLYSLINQNN